MKNPLHFVWFYLYNLLEEANYANGKQVNGSVNLKLFWNKKLMGEKSLKGWKDKFGEKIIVHFYTSYVWNAMKHLDGDIQGLIKLD